MNRRRFLQIATLGAASTLSVPGLAFARAHQFDVVRHSYLLAGLERPLRVVQLSDLHFGPWHKEGSVRAWVRAALGAKPDAIVITGDLVDAYVDHRQVPRLIPELARLHAPLGVYAIPGNHDYALGKAELKGFMAALERQGIRFLVNAGAPVRDDLYLMGVDDFWFGLPDLYAAMERAPKHGARLLLSHNPDFLPMVPLEVGLTLSGHTHGGQVRIPFMQRPIIEPSRYGERFMQGFVQGPAPGFVSRGLGTSTLPFRLRCPAELVVFDFVPVK